MRGAGSQEGGQNNGGMKGKGGVMEKERLIGVALGKPG